MATSDNGNMVVIPSSIKEGVYMFTVNKSKREGNFQLAEVEKFSEGDVDYYDLQVSPNPRSGDTFKSFNIRRTDTHAEEAPHDTPTEPVAPIVS